MKSAGGLLNEGNLLKSGNQGNTGRSGPNKRIRGMIGEENMATKDPDKEIRRKCTEFLLEKVMPRPSPEGHYVKLDLPPMATLQDIKINIECINASVVRGGISLQESKELLFIVEQCRKVYELEDAAKNLEEIQRLMKEKGCINCNGNNGR